MCGLLVSARCSEEMESVEISAVNAASFLRSSTNAARENPSRESGFCATHQDGASAISMDAESRMPRDDTPSYHPPARKRLAGESFVRQFRGSGGLGNRLQCRGLP